MGLVINCISLQKVIGVNIVSELFTSLGGKRDFVSG